MKTAIQLALAAIALVWAWTAFKPYLMPYVCGYTPQAVAEALPFRLCVVITDGDTMLMGRETVRLLGIDAPEMASDYEREDPQPYAEAALEYLSECAGQRPYLERAKKSLGAAPVSLFDQYGRTLGIIYHSERAQADGLEASCNIRLVRQGLAHAYVFGNTPTDFADAVRMAEEQAKAEGIGVWSQDNPVLPSDYRDALRQNR